jgi:hypothetical protein
MIIKTLSAFLTDFTFLISQWFVMPCNYGDYKIGTEFAELKTGIFLFYLQGQL